MGTAMLTKYLLNIWVFWVFLMQWEPKQASNCRHVSSQELLGSRIDIHVQPTIFVSQIIPATRETRGRVCASRCTACPLPKHEEAGAHAHPEHLDPSTPLLGHVALSCCSTRHPGLHRLPSLLRRTTLLGHTVFRDREP